MFGQMESENPLKDRHVCLSGEFRVPDKKLKETLLSIGAKPKKMEKEDELVLNPYFAIAFRESKEPTLGFSLGDLLSGLSLHATA